QPTNACGGINMQRDDVIGVLNDPLAQELIRSNIPARLAYTSLDGSPRAVPLGFHWNGRQFVICTVPGSPKVRALAAHPGWRSPLTPSRFHRTYCSCAAALRSKPSRGCHLNTLKPRESRSLRKRCPPSKPWPASP